MSESTPTKMTQEEALDALRTYVSQQVEYETIDLIAGLIDALGTHVGKGDIQVSSRGVPFDYKYNEVLRHAEGLNLGPLVPPAWLERFSALVTQVREEFDLHETVATPMGGCAHP